MNYVMTSDFLFKSDTCTTIRFIQGSSISCFEDTNDRSMNVVYVSGVTKYSDLNDYLHVVNTSDNLVTDGTYLLRVNTNTNINGINYYTIDEYKFISCILMDVENIDIYAESNSIVIVTNPISLSKYIKSINNTRFMYCDTDLIEDNFVICNFTAVDMLLNTNVKLKNDYVHTFDEFSIDDSKITTAFIKKLKSEFPEYTIAPELNEMFDKSQKQNIIIYESRLAEHGNEYSTHVRTRSDTGRYAQVTIDVNLEILTDDIQTYINTRDKLLMNTHLFSVTTFNYTDELGRVWTYTCNWSNNDLSGELERTPKSRYFDETILYTINVTAKLIGWLVEKFSSPNIIENPIVLIYSKLYGKTTTSTYKLKSIIKDGKMDKDLSVGLRINSDCRLIYKINNINYMARIDENTGEFSINNSRNMKYTGKIDFSLGKVTFNPRVLKDKTLEMDDGELTFQATLATNWETTYRVVAEILTDLEYNRVKNKYKYHRLFKNKHIVSINEKLMDAIEDHFDDLWINKDSVRIISSNNEVSGISVTSNQSTINSGSSFLISDSMSYNLFNYLNGKFYKIKELKS